MARTVGKIDTHHHVNLCRAQSVNASLCCLVGGILNHGTGEIIAGGRPVGGQAGRQNRRNIDLITWHNRDLPGHFIPAGLLLNNIQQGRTNFVTACFIERSQTGQQQDPRKEQHAHQATRYH